MFVISNKLLVNSPFYPLNFGFTITLDENEWYLLLWTFNDYPSASNVLLNKRLL